MSRQQPSRLPGAEGRPLFSLRDINALAVEEKERIYAGLLPQRLFTDFAIDRKTFRGPGGGRRVWFICPPGLGLLRIEVRLQPQDRDPLFFAELADTPFRQIELSLCLINDPAAPRYDIDVDEAGRDNCFGTLRRNIPEELRAMAAGLSPNQVRQGLGLFSPFFQRLERLVTALGIDSIVAEPLSYGNAIRYERYGFDYLTGRQFMLRIDREFRPGGELHRRLDGSTPFRRSGMGMTVRGRSWAIQDGILQIPWDGVRIYKVPGVDAGVDTFPGREF
jgi:hypothetical protein